MFQKILLSIIASSVCMLIIGVFIGTAIANQLPMTKDSTENTNSDMHHTKIQALEQEVIKQSNMRQNCELLLNKLQK